MTMRQNLAAKYLAIGSAVIVFLGLTVWLVRSEGRRTRESIREAAKDVGNEVRRGIVNGAEQAADKAAEVPTKIVRNIAKEGAAEGASTAKQVVDEAGPVSARCSATSKISYGLRKRLTRKHPLRPHLRDYPPHYPQ